MGWGRGGGGGVGGGGGGGDYVLSNLPAFIDDTLNINVIMLVDAKAWGKKPRHHYDQNGSAQAYPLRRRPDGRMYHLSGKTVPPVWVGEGGWRVCVLSTERERELELELENFIFQGL